MVEEKARCLLSRPEFTSLCYYTDEYASRHMTIDAFVQVMTELLNTADKVGDGSRTRTDQVISKVKTNLHINPKIL